MTDMSCREKENFGNEKFDREKLTRDQMNAVNWTRNEVAETKDLWRGDTTTMGDIGGICHTFLRVNCRYQSIYL